MAPSPVRALVMIKAISIPFEEVFLSLRKYPAVKRAWGVTGDIDIILFVETKDTRELFDLVKKIREEPWCMSTKTSIILASYPE